MSGEKYDPAEVRLIPGTTGPMFIPADGSVSFEAKEISPDALMVVGTGHTLAEWQDVARRKWEHYLNNVLPSGNPVSISIHEASLLKLIPFLIGRPDLAMTMEREEEIYNQQIKAHTDRRQSKEEFIRSYTREDHFDTNDDQEPWIRREELERDC